MQAAAIGLAAGGSLIKGIGGYKAGKQNKKALDAQATEELRAGAAEEALIRDRARLAIGEQLAGQFGNGFVGGTGSALDSLAMSQTNAALDALTVRRDAAGKARSLHAQGTQAAREGKFALLEGIFGAGSAALSQKADWAAARSGQTPQGGGGDYRPAHIGNI